MLLFIGYVITGMLISWIFKLTAGLFEAIVMSPFGFIKGGFNDRVERVPKTFVTVLAIKNTVIGLANATMIFIITAYFLNKYETTNYWVYVIASIVWSLYIVTINAYFPLSTIMTSTGTLVLYWLGFGYFGWVITGFIGLIVSLAYYYGRINVILEQGRA